MTLFEFSPLESIQLFSTLINIIEPVRSFVIDRFKTFFNKLAKVR